MVFCSPLPPAQLQPGQLVRGEWVPLSSNAVMTRVTTQGGTRPRLYRPPALYPSIQLRYLVHPTNISDP